MKKLFISAVLSLSALAATPVFADTGGDITDAGARAESEQAVKELLVAMKYRELIKASFQGLAKNLPAMIMQDAAAVINGNAKLSAEEKQRLLASKEKALSGAAAAVSALINDPKLLDELENEIVPLYSKYFTASEVRAMAVFYKSDVGVKSLRVLPLIVNESMLISQKIMNPRITKLIEKLTAEAAK